MRARRAYRSPPRGGRRAIDPRQRRSNCRPCGDQESDYVVTSARGPRRRSRRAAALARVASERRRRLLAAAEVALPSAAEPCLSDETGTPDFDREGADSRPTWPSSRPTAGRPEASSRPRRTGGTERPRGRRCTRHGCDLDVAEHAVRRRRTTSRRGPRTVRIRRRTDEGSRRGRHVGRAAREGRAREPRPEHPTRCTPRPVTFRRRRPRAPTTRAAASASSSSAERRGPS